VGEKEKTKPTKSSETRRRGTAGNPKKKPASKKGGGDKIRENERQVTQGEGLDHQFAGPFQLLAEVPIGRKSSVAVPAQELVRGAFRRRRETRDEKGRGKRHLREKKI